MPIFLALLLGGVLVLALAALAFRRFCSEKMPLAGSCSLAISAACHRAAVEDEGIVRRPLQYGVLMLEGDGPGEYRVGFSAEPVSLLEDGETYY